MPQSSKIIIGTAAAVIILGGLLFFAQPQETEKQAPQPEDSSGNLMAEKTFYDFGTISMKDGKVNYSYNLKNDSEESVVIDKIYTSCMCTEAFLVAGDEKLGPYGMH